MTDVRHNRHTLQATDDHDIHVQTWEPADQATVVIQVLHGLGEHAERYGRFAAAAAEQGFAVCAHDQRGHGEHSPQPRHFADTDGWQSLIDDALNVNQFLRETLGDVPVVLLGHSMGSYVAQSFAMHYGGVLSGLILSASTWPARTKLLVSRMVAAVEAWRVGAHVNSPLLDKLGFNSFNKPFEPGRTALDWLSRDETEVDKYIADPLCGGPFTARLWQDLLGGLYSIGSDTALLRIPATLPILITGGTDDPVGGEKGMTKLLNHYAQTGHQRLKYKVYADGRHEMLNEINRDEVTRDWLDWIEATTRSARSH